MLKDDVHLHISVSVDVQMCSKSSSFSTQRRKKRHSHNSGDSLGGHKNKDDHRKQQVAVEKKYVYSNITAHTYLDWPMGFYLEKLSPGIEIELEIGHWC